MTETFLGAEDTLGAVATAGDYAPPSVGVGVTAAGLADGGVAVPVILTALGSWCESQEGVMGLVKGYVPAKERKSRGRSLVNMMNMLR